MKRFDPRTSFDHEQSMRYNVEDTRGDEEQTVAFLAQLAGRRRTSPASSGTGPNGSPVLRSSSPKLVWQGKYYAADDVCRTAHMRVSGAKWTAWKFAMRATVRFAYGEHAVAERHFGQTEGARGDRFCGEPIPARESPA